MESGGNWVIIFAMCAILPNENVFSNALSDSLVNIALRKPANQSSTYIGQAVYGDTDNFKYSASLAVDGNNSTNFRNDSCSHTDANHTSAWWEVDLQDSYLITKVKIYQRSDRFTNRNAGSTISGKLENNEYIQLKNVSESDSSEVIIDVPSRNRFKGIRIHNQKAWGIGYDVYICLCEVQVFTDVDECIDGDSVCNNKGKCVNTPGSFNCICHGGFTGKICERDVNECTRHNICSGRGRCINNVGSFTCECNAGYTGHSCNTDVDECIDGDSVCSNKGKCVNTPGSFNCICHGGFTGKICETDVDECTRHNICSGRGKCINTVGRFTCECNAGYTGQSCNTDVDECIDGDSVCNNKGKCVNTPGSFNCICHGGFTGKICETDVDECTRRKICSGRGRCINTVGSFTCECNAGYTGQSCNTVIRCNDLVAPNHSQLSYKYGIERMSNTFNATVLMACDPGYIADGETFLRCGESGTWGGSLGRCTDVDECSYGDSVCNNNGRCVNSPGSFNCICHGGFTGKVCETDVDECISRNICSSRGKCINTFGSFTCECYAGYTGQSCNAVMQCRDLEAPNHSQLRFKNGIERMSNTFNATVLMACVPGYIAVGETLLRCGESGTWGGSLGHCTVIRCDNEPIQSPVHGKLNYTGGIEGTGTYNTEAITICDQGYHLTMATQVLCKENGKWEGSPGKCSVIQCTKEIDQPDNSELTYNGGIEGSRTYNTVVTTRCKEGYNLTEISYIRCNEQGEWEGSSGHCSVIFCKELIRTNNSILSIDGGIEGNWTYNTTATVACDLGYTLTGNKRVRCTHSSQWNGSIGYCVAMEFLVSDYHAAGSVGGIVVAVFLVVVGAIIGILVYRRLGRPLEQTAETASEELPRSSEGISNIIKVQNTSHKVIYAKPIQMKEQVSKTSEVNGDNEYTNNGDSSREYYSYLPKKVTDKHAIQLEDLSSFFLGRKMDLKLYHEEYNKLPQGLCMRHDTAILPENQKKNRYKNIYPYDDTRVQLEIWDPATETDYINACYVNGFKSFHAYIAAQGPTLEILNDFWRMIWQTKSLKIVMLTNLIEDGKHKCEKYWPDEGSIEFGAISVRLVQCESFSDFTVRTLELTKVQQDGNEKLEQRHVKQFHFTAWPDKRVPRYASSLVHFRRKVRNTRVWGSTDGPIVVHCSAGIGRTGTFLALDYLVEQAEELGYINVFKCLETFRKQRVGLVQTAEQYIFVHEALVEALTCTTSALSTSEFLKSYNTLLEADVTNMKRNIDFEFEKLTMYVDDATEDVFENGKRTENRKKNRYSNILPDKNYCPFLNVYVKGRGSYINAVFLPAYKKTDLFIITQTPLENTKVDFWRMVYQFDVRSIVMMNTLSQMKDEERYWPEDEKELEIPPFRITLESKSTDDIYCNYNFSLRYSEHLRKVQLSRAIYWSDDEPVPKSPSAMLKQIDLIQSRQQETGNKPIIVHCMNGAERSGLFCVVAALIERMMTEQDVAIEQIIKQMRSRRPQVIPSVVQFKFCYDAIKTHMEQYDSYANFARP